MFGLLWEPTVGPHPAFVEKIGVGTILEPHHIDPEMFMPYIEEYYQKAQGCAGHPLFVALYVDEERFQHPAIRAPDVPVAEVVRFIRQAPATTVVLNSLKVEHALPLLEAGLHLDRVYLDVNAMDMPFDGLRSLVETHGVDRLVFGTQMPFLYPEAALMVVEHSGLASVEIEAILERNWQASPVLAGLAF
jgi:hypothetical protein